MIAVTAFTAGGCKKLLDQDPINSPYNDAFWKDEKDAMQALAGNYALLRKSLTTTTAFGGDMSHFAYGDLTAFEFSDFDQYDLDFLVEGGKDLGAPSYIGDYLGDLQDWTPYYQVITQSNIILHNMPGIPDNKYKSDPVETRSKIMGEALFLRTYAYFYMVRLWGDVPLVTAYDPDPAHAQPIPRNSELEVLDTCINNAKQAIALLLWDYKDGSGKAVRANKGSAYALLAHLYMWKHFRTNGADPKDLEQAIAAITEISKSGKYQLLPAAEFASLFKGKSNEGIFEINMQAAQNEQQQTSGFYYKITKEPYVKNKTSKNGVVNMDMLKKLYTPEDLRYQYYFDFRDNQNDPIITKYTGKGGENIFYKDVANFAQAAVSANIILFRYADVLLLRAEANAKLGRYGEARTDLNAVRARAGLEPSSKADAALLYEIFAERSRELFAEGQRWYDLVRMRAFNGELGDNFDEARLAAEGWKWPVARSLFINNFVLKQNKFWEGKVN